MANVILSICELYHISLPEATDMFYSSSTATMIEDGIADLQCRSNKYLATLIWEEQNEKAN
ncbi:MAG: DUF3791 domain-containing protein [Muribaculaceae bacterium]|nr:DUF3791 domain-containing protein [Bacteroidales bacterium]MDE6436787.1 DUF3791 domain-containing protein [Muribaculaceae bacterium]